MCDLMNKVKSEPQTWQRCYTCHGQAEECMPISSETSDPNCVTVMDVLIKHFWFQRDELFGTEHVICENCWHRLDDFHQFYQLVEENHRSWNQESPQASDSSPNTIDVHVPGEDEIEIKEEFGWHQSEGEEPEQEYDTACISSEEQSQELEESILAPRRSGLRSGKVTQKRRADPKEDEDEKIIKTHMQYECSLCQKDFETFYQYKVHMVREHKKKAIVSCCSKRFYKRKLLMEHVLKVQDPDRFKCDICNKVLINSEAVQKHKRDIHELDKKKIFCCNRCPQRFARAVMLEFHMKGHDNMDKGSIRCSHCQEAFPSVNFLKWHIKDLHSSKGFVCDVCGKAFVMELELRRHQREHVPPEELRVQCNICHLWLKNMRSLRAHNQIHTGPMTCKVCGVEFQHYAALSKHKNRKHKTKPKHECVTCGVAFQQASQLKKHSSVHQEVGKGETNQDQQ